MSTPTPGPHASGDPTSAAPTTPASPGPDPDDVNTTDDSTEPATRGAGGDGQATTAPTSPGPDPDDINR